MTPAGAVAAVCLYPEWVPRAVGPLAGTGVRIAAVANFPAGDDDPARAAAEAAAAAAAGAGEVDVVVPWQAHLGGDAAAIGRLVARMPRGARLLRCAQGDPRERLAGSPVIVREAAAARWTPAPTS